MHQQVFSTSFVRQDTIPCNRQGLAGNRRLLCMLSWTVTDSGLVALVVLVPKNLLVQTHFLSGFTKKNVAVLKTPVDHEFEMQS